MDLESTRHSLFHKVWRVVRHTLERSSHETSTRKQTVLCSKDQRRKLAEVAERTTLERTRKQRSRRRNFKDSCTFFKNRQRLTKKSSRMEEHLKNSKNSFKIVKDCCRRQHRLKFFEIRSNLSKIEAVNKESVYFFQIFERFTDLSSTRAKNASQVQRTTVLAVRFVLRTDPKRETSSEGTRRAWKRRKSFSR
jgi:hypothetical protein